MSQPLYQFRLISRSGAISGAVLAAVSATIVSGCAQSPTVVSGSPNTSSPNTSSPDAASPIAAPSLRIVTSTLPLTNFTKAVAGDRAEVIYLLPTNVGPHDFQAKPEDVRTIAEADLLVRNGLGMDNFLDDLIKNANNADLKVIDTSEGVATITNESVEGHDHAEGEAHDHAEGGHSHEGEYNPHIWLDPQRAIEQVENIRDGLIAADPDGQAIYTANATAYIDRLKAFDAETAAALKPFAGKEFVTYHDFAPYFADRYGLKAEYLVDVPEENPSPADVQRVIGAAQDSQLKTLLTEPQATDNPFSALAKDLQVQVSSFDPMETSGAEGVQPDYYFTVMRQNVENLKAAFGNSPQSWQWTPNSPRWSIAQLPHFTTLIQFVPIGLAP